MDIQTSAQPAPAILYYDGNCSLCLREMARLGKLKSAQLQLVDIHEVPPDSGLPDRDTLLRTLHLQLPDGHLLTGADANVAAWQHTRHGLWFRWMRWPGLRLVVDRVYDAWARWRYRRLYGQVCALRNDPGSAD